MSKSIELGASKGTGSSSTSQIASRSPEVVKDIHVSTNDATPAILGPGSVLNVTIERSSSGQDGILVKGQFVPAKLPPQLLDGQRVQVQVQAGQDSVILKLLNIAPDFPTNFLSQTISQLLQELLPDLNLDMLRSSVPSFLDKLPKDLAQKLLSQGQTELRQESADSSIDPKLAKIVERLIQDKVLLSDQQLSDPNKIQTFLTSLNVELMLKNTLEAKTAVEKLVATTPSPQQVRILETVRATISALLEAQEPITFDTPATPQVLAQQLRLYLIASQSAMDSGNLPALDNISADISALKRLQNPLGLLSRVLFSLDFSKSENSDFQKATIEITRNLASDLQLLKEQGGGDKEIRTLLGKVRERITSTLEHSSATSKTAPAATQTFQMIKHVEQVLQGQDLLNRMNPIMQSLGEPIFILFPAIADGLISKWQIKVQHSKVEEEDSNRKGRKTKVSGQGFERVELSANFPALGTVQMDLAHRPGELLLSLTFDDQAKADFTSECLTKLTKRFNELGFSEPTLKTGCQQKDDISPGWYKELIAKSVVA